MAGMLLEPREKRGFCLVCEDVWNILYCRICYPSYLL